MSVLKAAVALLAIPMHRVEGKLPDHVETKTLLDYAFRTLVLLLSIGMGYTITLLTHIDNELDNLNTRIVRIEASRFTAQDGALKADKLAVPPIWFLRRVDEIEERVDRLEGR